MAFLLVFPKGNVLADSPSSAWTAYYYNNTSMSGNAVYSKTLGVPDGSLSENVGTGSPAPGIVNSDYFSAKYVSYRSLKPGNYVIHTQSDDGIRVLVDGNVVLDAWGPSNNLTHSATFSIGGQTAEYHWIEVQYEELTGNSDVNVSITPANWLGFYYNNTDMSGNAVYAKALSNPDGSLYENAGTGSPVPGVVNSNYFSAKYVSYRLLNPGDYIIRSESDDGVRVLVDGSVVFDNWGPADGRKHAVMVNIPGQTASYHWIQVQYEQFTGNSMVNVSLTPLSNEVNGNTWLGVYQSGTTNAVVGGRSGTDNLWNADFNWGTGSPYPGIAPTNFTAKFYKQIAGNTDYLVQTYADDGVRVNLDGQKTIVDRYSDSSGQFSSGIITGLSSGDHQIETDYYQNLGKSALFSDVIPFGSWEGYYYNNQDLSGDPVNANLLHQPDGSLYQDNGYGSPVSGVSNEHFSARYFSAQHLQAGDYVLRTRVDDGVRVLVDGNVVFSRWANNSGTEYAVKFHLSDLTNSPNPDVHIIEVQYYQNTGRSKVQVSISPFANQIPSDGWISTYYNNETLDGAIPLAIGGTDSTNKISNLNFNWGTGSPAVWIQSDHYSADYQRNYNLTAGNYKLDLNTASGARVYVDGNLEIDSWNTPQTTSKMLNLNSGIHHVEVQYHKATGSGHLSFNLSAVVNPSSCTSYLCVNLLTPSDVTASEINNYVSSNGGAQLQNMGQFFLDEQSKYGINALYLAAHAIHETGDGQSPLAQLKHNYFGLGAFDSYPFTNAYYFQNVQDSIDFEASFVACDYLMSSSSNPNCGQYYAGPTLTGMNVHYATDPLWGQKIANIMQAIHPYNAYYYGSVENQPASRNINGVNWPDKIIPAGQPQPATYSIPNGGMTITLTGDLHYRSYPAIESNTVVGLIPNGSKVRAIGLYEYDGWVLINYNNGNYWIMGDYTNLLQTHVNGGAVNVRNSAGTSSSNQVIDTLNDGQFVLAILDNNLNKITTTTDGYTWVEILDPKTNQPAWVAENFLYLH